MSEVRFRQGTDEEFLRDLLGLERELLGDVADNNTASKMLQGVIGIYETVASEFYEAHGERAICVLRGMAEMVSMMVNACTGFDDPLYMSVVQANLCLVAYSRPLTKLLKDTDVGIETY